MKIKPGRTYRFKNKKVERYLSPKGFSRDEAKTVQILNPRDGHQRDAQTWHVMPIDDGVLVVNKDSQRVLSPQGFETSEATTVQILDLREPAGKRATQIWVVEDAGDGSQLLRNHVGDRYVSPQGFSGEEATTVQILDLRDGDRRDAQCWVMEVVDEEKRITKLEPVARDVNAIGDDPEVTGYHPPAERTPEVLVAQTVVPFPLVQDTREAPWQSHNNPYYLLRRYGYWEQVLYCDHDGQHIFEAKREVTVGLTTSNSSTIERTLGVSVGADAGIECKGVSASIHASMTNELKVATTRSKECKYSDTYTLTRTFPGDGKRVAHAVWYRGDRYALERLDGSCLLEWRTLTDKLMVEGAFPR